MSIGVPRGVVFVAALVVVVIPVSHYAYTRFRDTSDKHINTSGRSEHPESSTDPQVLLSEANRLYWLNSGPKAAHLSAKAKICLRVSAGGHSKWTAGGCMGYGLAASESKRTVVY